MTASRVSDSLPAPTVVEVVYDDKALTVTVTWNPVPGYQDFAVALHRGGKAFETGTGFGGQGVVKLDAPLDADVYEVAAAVVSNQTSAPTQGPFGNWVEVITGRLSSLSAATEPLRVSASWGLPKGGPANAAELAVFGPSQRLVAEKFLPGSEGAVDLPRGLDPTVAYTLRARPAFGGSLGPYLDLPLVSAVARVAEIVYEPSTERIEVLLQPPVPSGFVPGAALFADGTLVRSERNENGGALVTLPAGKALDPSLTWEVRPFWCSGEARGPYGPAAVVVVESPTIRRVEWADDQLAVAWSNYPGPPYPTGAEVTVAPSGASKEPPRKKGFLDVSEGAFTPEPPLSADTAYVAAVAALRGSSYGPPGAPVPVLAAKPPAPSWARYDGSALRAGWQATAPPQKASGCSLVVLQGDTEIARVAAPAGASGAAVEVPLAPGLGAAEPYAVALQWTAERSRGPLGPTTDVIAAVPGVQGIVVTDTLVEVTVERPAAEPGIAGFTASLLRDGELLASKSVPLPASGNPIAAIPYATGGRGGYEVRVAATAGKSSGPESPPVPVPSAPPRVTRAVLDSSELTLEWELPPGPDVASTTVVVTPNSGDAVRFPGLTGSSATLTLPSSLLTPGLTLTLQASCVTSLGTTPQSEVLKLLTGTPALERVCFDGGRVTAAWSWPQEAPDASIATAYRLSLRVGGVEVQSAIAAGLSGGLVPEAPLGPTAAAELRVDALAGAAEALATAGTPLLTAAPRLLDATVKGDEVTLSFADAAGAEECSAVFSSPGYEETSVPKIGVSPATVAVPALAADPLVPLRVALVAEAGIAQGPRSESLPVLRTAVAPRLAREDAGTLTVEWDEVPDGATAYVATLFKAGTAEGSAMVEGPPARLDTSGAEAATAYTAGVVARAGGAAGPATAPLPVLLAPATLAEPSFDGSTLTATVTAPGGTGATLSGYELSLLRNGNEVQRIEQGVPGEGTLRLAVDSPVDPHASYELAVRPRAGAALGPATRVAALLVPPSLDSVSWQDQTLTVSASPGDLPPDGLTIYATLFEPKKEPQVKPLTDGSASFAAPAGSACEVSVHGETAAAKGPLSPRLTALTEAPAILSARFSAGRVTALWGAVGARAYAVAVSDAAGAVVAAATVEGLSAELDLDPQSGAAYTLAVTPLDGRVSGQPAALPLVVAGCRTKTTGEADGRTVSVEWSLEEGGPTPTGFVPVARWEGAEIELDTQPAGSSSARLVLPAAVPAGAAIGVRALAGTASGPLANLAPVVASAPEDLRLRYADGTLHASWRPPADGRVTGALVTLEVDGKATSEEVAGRAWSAPVAAGSAATVAVAALAGDGAGPTGGPLAAILSAPKVEKCRFDGSLLEVEWEPTVPKGVTGWRVAAKHRDRVVAEAAVTEPRAVLPLPTQSLPFEASDELTVTVTAIGEGVEGPESAPTAALAVGPRVTAAVTDGLTGTTTVSWDPVSTAETPTYVLSRYVDGAFVDETTTTATSAVLPALKVEQDWEVAVAAQAPPGTLEGPPGPRFQVSRAAPTIELVGFDGATATVRWRGVPGASGYAIDVFGGDPPSPIGQEQVDAGAREARVAVKGQDKQVTHQVSVRALFGPSSGPRALAPLFSPGIYLGAGEPARILRASSEAIAAEAQVAYLPPMGVDADRQIAPLQPGTDPPTAPFVLAANADRESAGAFPCTLTIDHGALAFDANRPSLRGTFLKLLTEAETKGAKPWGLFAIQAAVARLMPQTFEETLLYAYGLDAANSSVDLVPGLVLRVAFSEFDTAAEKAPAGAAGATGYAGGAVVDYEVGDYFAGEDWLVGFDAFVAWLAGNSVLGVPAPVPGSAPPGDAFSESGAAEAADLFFPGFRTAFHRLFVPPNLLSPNAAAPSRTREQFTLAAAASFTDLQGSSSSPVPTKTSVAYFRGRAVVKPSLRIAVNGNERVVPLGTSVGNVLDGLGRRPPSTGTPLRGVSLERSLGPVVLDPSRGYDAAACERVALEWEGLRTFGAPRDALSLPLLHGDRLTVAE